MHASSELQRVGENAPRCALDFKMKKSNTAEARLGADLFGQWRITPQLPWDKYHSCTKSNALKGFLISFSERL